MEPSEYRTMYDSEESYWWYRGLRAALFAVLEDAGIGEDARVLDAGCGTGKTLEMLRRRVTPSSFGFDRSAHAASFWPLRNLDGVFQGSVTRIPVADASCDAVLCVDVLETVRDEDEAQACRELWRVAKPGGTIVVVVPAYRWLMNQAHHRAVHAVRRYTKARILALMQRLPVRVMRMTHLFPTALPGIAAYRWVQQAWPSWRETPRSDARPLPGVVNETLAGVCALEARLLRQTDFLFGSSLMAVVKKDG